RRGAARLPAAADARQALAGVRARGGAGAPGPRRRRGRCAAEGRRRGGRRAVARPPLTFRRLTGLDRSGPPPPETRPDAPWHVWTVPNAIGFVRLALIPI